jgi:hypothetical protein
MHVWETYTRPRYGTPLARRDDLPGDLRVALEVYVDEFAAKRKSAAKVKAVNVVLANCKREIRVAMPGIYAYAFFPHGVLSCGSALVPLAWLASIPFAGADVHDCLEPLGRQVKRLEDGVVLNILGQKRRVSGAMLVVLADMPEAASICGIVGPTGNKACRWCFSDKADYLSLQPGQSRSEAQFVAIRASLHVRLPLHSGCIEITITTKIGPGTTTKLMREVVLRSFAGARKRGKGSCCAAHSDVDREGPREACHGNRRHRN